MKFDLVVTNPPYNKSSGGVAGSSGDTRLFKRFRTFALKTLKPNGRLLMVCPKSIIADLNTSNNQVEIIDLMTDVDYWDYNTCYFVEQNRKKKKSYKLIGFICSKIFGWREWELSRPDTNREPGDILSITELPKKANNWTAQFNLCAEPVESAPRFAFSILESVRSYTVTDQPYALDANTYASVVCSTLTEAEALKRFIQNNKLVKFYARKMKFKGIAENFLKMSRKFDLTQIQTGYEYPIEYGLTQEEIEYVENSIDKNI